MPSAEKRLPRVGWLSSAARMPLPEDTSARAVDSSCVTVIACLPCEDSCYRSDGLLRALRIWPVQMEELPARRVHALVGMRAEVIALGLEEVGGEARRSIAVEVGQRAPECGHGDAVPHRERHDLAPGFLARGEGPLEVGVEHEVHQAGVLAV